MADPSDPHGQFGVYRRLVTAQLRGYLSYRASFAMDLLANALVPIVEVVSVLAMFQVTRSLGGFSAAEVLVMYGLSASAFALSDLVVGNIERIPQYVRQGLLDAVLVRPLPVLGQLLALDFTIRRVGRFVIATGILVGAALHAGITWTPVHLALAVVAVISGAALFGALFVMTATVAFWWIDSRELAASVTYGGRDFTAYPITVYNGAFRALFAYALGFGFVAYFPALGLLERADPLGLPGWLAWATPVVAGGAAVVAAAVWRIGVRHYRSTGS